MSEPLIDLQITALAQGGRGLGHHDGKVIFVPFTVPGDRIDCRITRAKARFAEAELVAIRQPSAHRRDAPCPWFGSCGGCQWQQLPYPQQARWKEQLFREQLVRNGICADTEIAGLVSAPDEWRYRNRVQLKCHAVGDGLAIGFYRQGSHFVVDVADCRLLRPELQAVLTALRNELPDAPERDAVPQVDLACGDDGTVRIVLHVLPWARRSLREWLQHFAGRHQLNACLQSGRKDTIEVVHGEPFLTIQVDEPALLLRYGPGGFVQVNTLQNRAMVATMVEWLALTGVEHALDLFCGMGNFSLPLARRAGRVVGVEDYPPSIASARENAAANGLDNVVFHASDAAVMMQNFRTGELDLVVLDPPRTGHYQAVRDLLKIAPRRVLYVSCDPATLARDLKPLVHGGYRVRLSRPFDLFPQTWHVESMTLLERT